MQTGYSSGISHARQKLLPESARSPRIVFIQVRNTSDKPNFDIVQPIKAAIVAKGYRITEDPDQAHFKLQAQVLSVTKADPRPAATAETQRRTHPGPRRTFLRNL